MKKSILILATAIIALQFSVSAQYKSKARALIQSKQPGASLEFNYERTKPYGLTHYHEYGFKFRKKAPLPGYPNAIATGTQYASYWANGSKKELFPPNFGYYEGMPKPSLSKLNAAVNAADFTDLNTLINVGIADQNFANSLISIDNVKLSPNMKFDWVNEKKVYAGSGTVTSLKEGAGYVTLTYINGSLTTKQVKRAARFLFERDAYNSAWRIARINISTNGEDISEKKYTSAEMVKIKNSTLGARFAEEIAKKDWESLPEIDIPEFASYKDFFVFTRNYLLTAKKDEVKAFFYHSAPSYNYVDGSQYRLEISYLQMVNRIMTQIFDRGEQNFRTEYCNEGVVKEMGGKRAQFYNKTESTTIEFVAEKEDGKYKIDDIKIGFSDDMNAVNDECKGLETKKYTLDKLNCSFNFPAQPEEDQLPPSKYKGFKYSANEQGYIFSVRTTVFNDSPDNYDNESRYLNAKDNAEYHIEQIMWPDKQDGKDFDYKGQKGYEIYASGGNRGGHGGPWGNFEVVVRYLMLENVLYEYYIKGPIVTEDAMKIMESFESTLSVSSEDETSDNNTEENVSEEFGDESAVYSVGDNVQVKYDWNGDGKDEIRTGKVVSIPKTGYCRVEYDNPKGQQNVPLRFIKLNN